MDIIEQQIPKTKVVIRDSFDLFHALRLILTELKVFKHLKKDGTLIIKPDLTTQRKHLMRGTNTNPEVLECLIKAIRPYVKRVKIIEADHLRYTAREAWNAMCLEFLERKYGVEFVSLSDDEMVEKGKLKIPKTLLEADYFITLPTLKTNPITYFHGGLQNQAACISAKEALTWNSHKLITEINNVRKPDLTIIDATQVRDPSVREMDVIIASEDPVAADATAMRLLQLDPKQCKYLHLAAKKGIGIQNPNNIEPLNYLDDIPKPLHPARTNVLVKSVHTLARSKLITSMLINKYVLKTSAANKYLEQAHLD